MNIIMDPPPSHSRSLSSSSAYSGNSLFPPPSIHGAPKSPGALSTRSSRSPPFPGMGLPSSPRPSEPRTPRSPMSPPMSAQSFGTFIDSEPSTPAYSPRMGSTWDNSTLVLLSPVSSVASSPGEPGWQMTAPIQKPPKRTTKRKVQPPITKEVSLGAALSSWPTAPVVPEVREEGCTPAKEEDEGEKKVEEEPKTAATTRERLTTRMKSLLRRRTDKKKTEKKQRYLELDRVETTHWTEL